MTQKVEVLINKILSKETSSYIRVLQAYKDTFSKLAKKKKIISKRSEKESSDSLLQQIHNLENCYSVDDSRYSGDPAENVLEREYRKLFASESKERKKTSKELVQNKASTIKRRIGALRRTFIKAGESTISSWVSANNQRDRPIISDSPFLEALYYSQTKINRSDAFPSLVEHDEQTIYETPSINNHNFICDEEVRSDAQRDILTWNTQYVENREIQADNGMLETYNKNLNYEENPPISVVYEKNIRKEETKILPLKTNTEKKEKKNFFFFRKKNKNKPSKSKDGVTIGRCDVKNGLLFKTEHIYKREQKIKSQSISEVYEEMTKAAWIQKFLSDALESQRSVKVRWNNKKYNTASSTAFELIEKIYENTGIFRSKSNVPVDSSYDKLFTNQQYLQHQMDFVPQPIEAWMIPNNVGDTAKTKSQKLKTALKKPNHEMEITLSGQKWFIEKSKALSHKIDLVLLSKSKLDPKKSSNYLQIDIPKGFFEVSNRSSKDSSNTKAELDTKISEQPSKEMTYKIIEYDTGNDLKKEINILKFDAANNKQNIQLTVNVKSNHDMKPLFLGAHPTNNIPNVSKTNRNVMSRGSNVSIQKRRGVRNGNTGQKDMQTIESPIKKIQDCPPDYKCKHESKKCKHELKKSKHESMSLNKYGECIDTFLRNYPRLWTLEEIELFSWCASDCLLRSCSDDSTSTPNHLRHVTQSCPHILNGFGAFVSSCDAPIPVGGELSLDFECENTSSWYSRDQKKCILIRDQNGVPTFMSCKRVIPKDSIEVYKRRQTIARSDNRCKWFTSNCSNVPLQSASNNECQSSLKVEKEPCRKLACQKSKANENTSNLKHDFLRDCQELDYFSKMLIDHNNPEIIELLKSKQPEKPCDLTQTFDQESSEKVMTLSLSSKSTSFELASNFLSRETSLSGNDFSSQDCMVSGPPNPQRSSPLKQNLSKTPKTTIKLTKTDDEGPTDVTLSNITKRPEPCLLPQSLSPNTNTRSAANKILSKTFFITQKAHPPSPLSDEQLPHLRNSSIVPKSLPFRPSLNSQASLLSTVLSCSSIRSEDVDQYLSKYPSLGPCPPITIDKPRTKTKHFHHTARDTADNRHLFQHKHMPVQSPTFNDKMLRNPKNERNHSETQCMMSRDIILPYPKPCRDRPDHSQLESRSPYNHHRRTLKMTPQSCQIAGTTDCWCPPAPVKHTDSFYFTKETLDVKKNKKDINVKVDNNEMYILLEKQNYRYPCLVPISKKSSFLPRNLYKHPLVQHSHLQQCSGHKSHEQRLETELPSKSCRIDSDKDDKKQDENKSDGSTKTIEINFRFLVPNGNKPINMKIVENDTDKNKVHLIEQILGNAQEVHISNKESIQSGTQNDKNDFNINICIKELKSNESKKPFNCCTDQMSGKPKESELPPQNRQPSSKNKQNKKLLKQPKSSYFKTEESTSRCEIQEILINVANDSITLQIPKTDINNCKPKKKEKCPCKSETQHTSKEHQTIKKTVKSHINTKIGETKTLTPEKSNTCKYYTTTRKYEEHISRPGSKVMKKPKTVTEPECKPKAPPPATREPQKRTSFMESMFSAANVVLSSNCSDSDLNENKMTDEAICNCLKTNLMKDANIINNNPRTESNITLTDIIILNEDVDYPTKDNRETINERTESAYVASDNDRLPQNWKCNDILWDVGKKCHCKRNRKNLKSQHTYCDLCSENDSDSSIGTVSYVDAETQNSRYLTSKYTSPSLSMRSYESFNDQNRLKRDAQLECTDVELTPLTTQFVSSRGKQKMTPSKGIRIYNEENKILRNMEATCHPQKAKDNTKIKREVEINVLQEASFLQSYATKKAVLEIYTENIKYKENDRLVAKLPKFAYDAENEVYDAIASNLNKFRCPKKMPLR